MIFHLSQRVRQYRMRNNTPTYSDKQNVQEMWLENLYSPSDVVQYRAKHDELETADVSYTKAVNMNSDMIKADIISQESGKHRLCQVFTEMDKVHEDIAQDKR